MSKFSMQQKTQLEKNLGRGVSGADLYMGHFLGAGGATKFLGAKDRDPTQSAAKFDPAAAKAGVDAYKAANGGKAPKIIYSTVPDADSLTQAQYLQQVWGEAGIEVEIKQIEQSTLIVNALFGAPDFDAFGWRNHGGLFVDNQYFWWYGPTAPPDGQLALNFGRLTDPVIDGLLEQQRSELDPAKRQSIAEDINRQFAKECWILPVSWTIWGIASNGKVGGLGTFKMPDGSGATVRDGVYFPGQVWLTQAYKRA